MTTTIPAINAPAQFDYSPWRHGGWYVHNVRYPSGACGCVSRNFKDKKWRIVCDPRPFEDQPTFRTRDEAARAEWLLVQDQQDSKAEPESFMDYWNAVDAAMLGLFAIDTSDAGIEPDLLAAAQEEGQTPEDFALWFGEKYGLTLISEFKATWCRA